MHMNIFLKRGMAGGGGKCNNQQRCVIIPNVTATESGYVLVVVLLVIFMGIILIGLTTALMVTNGREQIMIEQTMRNNQATDSAIENAILILLRNPAYQGGIMMMDEVPVEVTIATGSPTTITATSSISGQIQTTRAQVDRVNGMLEVQQWIRQ